MIELANGISLPEGAVVQSIVCHMDNAREYLAIVERIQYDKTLPVIEVYLSSGGVPYEVPENATVSVRLRKGDGKGVYNPALGLSEDRTRVYITITQQMTAVPGNCRAVVEVAAGGGVICASEFLLKVTENPVQEGAIESEDEYLTLTEILAQVQQMHGDVEGWKDQTLDYKKQAESMAINAVASASRAADSATNAADSAAQAGTSATNAANSAAQAASSAINAEKSAQEAKEAAAQTGDIKALQNDLDDLEGYVGYTDTDIYGLEADFAANTFTRLAGAAGKNPGADFDSIGAFGGRRRCNVTNEGTVIAYYGDAGYTETGKLTKAVTVDGTEYPVGYPVQVMVEQPRFYYRVVPLVLEPVENGRGCHLRKARYYVSDTPRAGFRLHPAFISNGKEKQAVYLSAYEGCLWDASASAYIKDDAQVGDFNTDMLSSIAGAKPASGVGVQNLSRSNARKLAENRGPGWEMAYAATLSVSQLLMVIEYASFHMQRAIGQGAVSKTDDGVSNLAENTGATASLGNASGTATNSNNIQMVSYRGEENLWGNIMEMVDGMNVLNPDPFTASQSGQLFVADHGFKENTGDLPYQETGLYPVYGAGFISAFGYSPEFDWLFVASELKGNLNFPVGDYFSSSDTGWRFPVVSGEWHRSNAAGPFYMNLAFVYGRSRNTNARLVYIPQGSQDPPTKEPVYQYEKGAANGVATLDSGAKVPVPQIPAANSLQVLNLGPYQNNDRIQTGQDLNNYTTGGSFWCGSLEIANTLLNCPYKGRFKLIVDEATQNGEIIYQYIIPGHVGYGSIYTIYYRVYDTYTSSTPWGPWRTMMSVVEGNQDSIQQTSALLNLRQEEGAWTPVLIARSGPAVSYTITENRGCKYWTLGDWVYITCYLRVRITAAGNESSGSRSYAGIQGLPFAVSTESRYPITVTELYGCVSNNWDVGYIDDDGGSSVYFQKDDGAAQEWWMVNSSSTNGGINFCGWYKKAT